MWVSRWSRLEKQGLQVKDESDRTKRVRTHILAEFVDTTGCAAVDELSTGPFRVLIVTEPMWKPAIRGTIVTKK